MNWKKIIKITGNILIFISIGFIIYNVKNYSIEAGTIILMKKNIQIIIISTFMWTFLVYYNSNSWRKILIVLSGKNISCKNVLKVYSKSNLGKYVPGRFLNFATRNLLGEKYGWGHRNILASSILELLFTLIIAAIISLFLLGEGFLYIHKYFHWKIFIIAILSVIIIIMLIKTTSGLNCISKKIQLKLSKKMVLQLFPISIRYIVSYVISSITFLVIADIFFKLNFNHTMFFVTGSYVFAWFSGFITPAVPGGLGVREAVLLLLLSSLFPKEQVLVVIIIHRLVTVAGDVLAYVLDAVIIDKMLSRAKKQKSNRVKEQKSKRAIE